MSILCSTHSGGWIRRGRRSKHHRKIINPTAALFTAQQCDGRSIDRPSHGKSLAVSVPSHIFYFGPVGLSGQGGIAVSQSVSEGFFTEQGAQLVMPRFSMCFVSPICRLLYYDGHPALRSPLDRCSAVQRAGPREMPICELVGTVIGNSEPQSGGTVIAHQLRTGVPFA
jgi:hypothetical protein